MLGIQIQQQIAEYLSGKISLIEFQRWFIPATWDVHLSGNQTATELAYKIELMLAEYTSGHLSEDEMQREMRPLIESYSVTLS